MNGEYCCVDSTLLNYIFVYEKEALQWDVETEYAENYKK